MADLNKAMNAKSESELIARLIKQAEEQRIQQNYDADQDRWMRSGGAEGAPDTTVYRVGQNLPLQKALK